MALQGQDIYRSRGCLGCHSVDGSDNTGPTWKGLYGKTETLADGSTIVVDDAYLIESTMNPAAKLVEGYSNIMPAYPDLSEEELQALVSYIKLLSEE